MAENPQRESQREPQQEPHSGPPRRLTRGRDSKIAGVCGGIAEYFDVDPTIVRVIFIVLLLFPFFPLIGGLVLYFLLWLVMPEPSPGEGGGPAAATSTAPGVPRGGSIDGGLLLGGVLLMLGFLFLFQRLFSVWWPGWWIPNLAMFAWPMLLIVIGGLIIVAALGRRR
jgi:phage shock protein C